LDINGSLTRKNQVSPVDAKGALRMHGTYSTTLGTQARCDGGTMLWTVDRVRSPRVLAGEARDTIPGVNVPVRGGSS
jgi:hypothetical protein